MATESMAELPSSVADILRESGFMVQVVKHVPVKNCREVQEHLGVEPERIAKGVLFTADEGKVLLAVVRASDRVDEVALARAARMTGLRIAPFSRAEQLTGYPPGALSPLGLPGGTTVVVDSNIVDLPEVFFGSGRHDISLIATGQTLLKLSRGTWALIALPAAEVVTRRGGAPETGVPDSSVKRAPFGLEGSNPSAPTTGERDAGVRISP